MKRADLVPIAAGSMLLAGIMHLLLLEGHLQHARGVGLWFLLSGTAQVLWAFLYYRDPNRNLRRFGLVALAIAPTVLYIITRFWRAPWSTGPEHVDVMGIATQIAQIGAGFALAWQEFADAERPVLPQGALSAIAVGSLIALIGYGGAIGSEDIQWLAEGEDAHIHGPGGHGHDDGHGHEDLYSFGQRGKNLVGSAAYHGPTTGSEIDQSCRLKGTPDSDCWLQYLKGILLQDGAVVAFDVLVELMEVNSQANSESHAIAHGLGHFAYQAYGYDIEIALAECSYEVFQGCIHGALQYFFDDTRAQGKEIDASVIRKTCRASSGTQHGEYACLHGLGHGLMLYTNYDLFRSLDLCSKLGTFFARESCYGGVYMENVVGYFDSINPTHAGGHQHGHSDEPPTFWVEPLTPSFPCNVVEPEYGDSCWRMQTSLILYFNGGDFGHVAEVCENDAGKDRLACYTSMGRDAAPYTDRNPSRMSSICRIGMDDAERACVEGFSAGEVLQENDPYAGAVLCDALGGAHARYCWTEVGQQAKRMWGEAQTATFCDDTATPYHEECRAGARL